MTSYKPLAVFWACVLVVLAGVAATVQVLGPVRPAARLVSPVGPAKLSPSPPPAGPAGIGPAPALHMVTSHVPEPDAALLEAAPGLPGRMLPRAAGGRVAASVYAAAFDPAERHPRVALVLDGAGLDRAMTALANRQLPSAIDFAFSAYAPPADAAALAQQGRRLGRECLVSIPMEPNGFPATEEGDHALLTGADPAQNRANLDRALSTVQGCVGATGGSDGLAGERFAAETQSYADLVDTTERRGLIYLDPRPGAPPRAGVYDADVVLDREDAADRPADAQAIDRNLAALDQAAARKGAAIGLAGPITPVLMDRVAVWAQGLAARGLVLAPLTAIPRTVAGGAP